MKTPRKLGTTTSTELVAMCQQLHVKLNYIGFKDDLPRQIEPGCYIINMQNDLPGTHWVCVVCCPVHACYIDSFGQPAPKEIHAFIQTRYKTYYQNVRQLQAVHSNACGFYVVAACGYFTKYFKGCSDFFKCIDTFLHLFDAEDQSKNDLMLKTVLAQL